MAYAKPWKNMQIIYHKIASKSILTFQIFKYS